MLSFSKPCVIPLSETYMMLFWAMHRAVLLVELQTTATLIVFLLCSHNRVLLILRLTKLSQCRSSFPAQELSVSLVRSYHLSSCLNQPFFYTKLLDHLSAFDTATTQSALHGDSVAPYP